MKKDYSVKMEKEAWGELIHHCFEHKKNEVNVDGFRKGQVPFDVYVKKFGVESLYMDAVDHALPELYDKLLEENEGLSLNMACRPEVNVKTISEDGLEVVFTVTMKPEVKLGKYKDLGIKKEEVTVTEEEIRMMVDVGEEKGSIKEEEKELINNVFEFNDKVVSEIMIHRKDIYAIDINSDIDNILKELDEYKYSRIPVYEENIDNIVGMLFIKDLLANVKKKEKVKISKIIREPYFVSENKPIDELFRDLQKNKHQLAIVLDEYGGTAGLVTMEDIIEELVGNIFDEYDEEEKEFEKIDDNTFLISGSVSIHDLRKILGVEIPEGEYDTLSGYLIELLGRIPSDDEKPVIETKRVTYKIEDYEEKRILWVKACRNNVEEDVQEVQEDEDKSDKEDSEQKEEN